MDNEALLSKIDNQQKLINELTAENEQLFQQFNHLMVRNGKLLKRIDDMQQIIDGMHLRIEEAQLINDNMLKLNDTLRSRNDPANADGAVSGDIRPLLDTLHRRIDELNLRNDLLQQRTSMLTSAADGQPAGEKAAGPDMETENIFLHWKNYPGQQARNAPNLRKQALMLRHLSENKSLNATALFHKTGVNGVTGARYVAVLKQFGLIEYKGARKKGQYHITQKGAELVEKSKTENEVRPEQLADVRSEFKAQNFSAVPDIQDL